MYPGFPLSNILESNREIKNILYQPHYSLYDLCILDMDLSFHSIDNNVVKFFDSQAGLIANNLDTVSLKSYGLFVTNSPMMSLKHNIATNMHLNSLYISHDQHIVLLKKEDQFLICQNTIRPHDELYYYPNNLQQFVCDKISSYQLKYCIPDTVNTDKANQQNDTIALLCYNKELPNNYLQQISGMDIATDIINKIPKDINTAADILGKYRTVVEFDAGSIINVLWAIRCGCIGIIIDNNNALQQYKHIPNLYIVHNIPELIEIIKNIPQYIHKDIPADLYVGLDEFKENMFSIFTKISKKAFVL